MPTPDDKSYVLSGKLLGEIVPGAPLQALPSEVSAADDPQAMQALTTAYITTMYYSAFTNLYLQGFLPEDEAEIDAQMPRFKIAFARTYADFSAAADWLAKNGGEYIASSPAKAYYDEVRGMDEGSIVNLSAAYSQATR